MTPDPRLVPCSMFPVPRNDAPPDPWDGGRSVVPPPFSALGGLIRPITGASGASYRPLGFASQLAGGFRDGRAGGSQPWPPSLGRDVATTRPGHRLFVFCSSTHVIICCRGRQTSLDLGCPRRSPCG